METTNGKMNKEQRTATDVVPDARDAPVPREETDDPRPGPGAAGTAKASHDEAIEKAVEGVHG